MNKDSYCSLIDNKQITGNDLNVCHRKLVKATVT